MQRSAGLAACMYVCVCYDNINQNVSFHLEENRQKWVNKLVSVQTHWTKRLNDSISPVNRCSPDPKVQEMDNASHIILCEAAPGAFL